MKTIGSGNTGSLLALMFDEDALLLSTAHQDTQNFVGNNIAVFGEDGASKRFTIGQTLWEENAGELADTLKEIENSQVVIFSGLGGGSGSSSLLPVSKILLSQNNQVLIIGILPFKQEILPPLANSVQAINSLMTIIDQVTVMIFDNQKLIKLFDSDWGEINDYIIKRVDYVVNLLRKYNVDEYSPMTLDQSELDSVIFGGGFLDISDTFIEEKGPKFEYGYMDKSTKNCMLVMYVDQKIKDRKKIQKYHKILTEMITKYSRRVPNSRMIPGILRASVNHSNAELEKVIDRAYLVLASGLNIDRYVKKIEKLRDEAIKRATAFSEKTKTGKVVSAREQRMLDI